MDNKKESIRRQFDLMEKGFDFGKTKAIKREKIYDRMKYLEDKPEARKR